MSEGEDPNEFFKTFQRVFGYSWGEHTDPINQLVAHLENAGMDVQHWTTHQPRDKSDFPHAEIAHLTGAEYQVVVDGNSLQALKFDSRAEAEAFREDSEGHFAERDTWEHTGAEFLVAMVTMIDHFDFIRARVRDENVDPGGCAEILTLMEESGSHVYTQVLLYMVGMVSKDDGQLRLVQEPVPFLRYATRHAPRPGLHNDLGSLFLLYAGLEADHIDTDEDFLAIATFGETEIPPVGPVSVMPDHRAELLTLAADCFARAYGYYVSCAKGQCSVESVQTGFEDVLRALDGLRVIAQERRDYELQELVFANYFVRSDVCDPGIKQRIPGEMIAGRFAYSLGIARGNSALDTIVSVERHLQMPTRASIVAEFAEEAIRLMRSAPAEQLAEAEREAAALAGATWVHLPRSVRDQFAQAVYMQSIGWHSSFDWAPVALPYFRGSELALSTFLAPSLEKVLAAGLRNFLNDKLGRSVSTWPNLTMGEFSRLLNALITDSHAESFIAATNIGSKKLLGDCVGLLRAVSREYRNIAAHGGEHLSGKDIEDIRRLLFETTQPFPKSLAQLMVDLRLRDGAEQGDTQ